jgi:hypothetical protein
MIKSSRRSPAIDCAAGIDRSIDSGCGVGGSIERLIDFWRPGDRSNM